MPADMRPLHSGVRVVCGVPSGCADVAGTTAAAIARLARSKSAASIQGAPGKKRPGARKYAKVPENMDGPKIMARPRNEPRGPCSAPCSDGETRRVMMDWEGAEASDHIAFTGIAARNIQPVEANPNMRKPMPALKRPINNEGRSPKRRTLQPTSSPEVMIVATPTRAGDSPTDFLFQP